jgi:NurA-like 5'-3' nuclease
LDFIFKELTRLTQEHYILGYPYPLVEAHNFVTLKKNFKEEIINRVKFSLYKDQRMDNVDIENLFLDFHERF